MLKTHLTAVYDCRTTQIIVIYYACTYNIRRIDPPDMEKIVYIIGVYYTYTRYIRGYYIHVKHGWQHCDSMASLHKQIEGQTVDYINIDSENPKYSLIILLVLLHSACFFFPT